MSYTSQGSKEKLLRSAEILFAECGYGSTSIRAISAHCGINAAMINYYFNGKEGSIIDEAEVWITANFKETQVQQMGIGQQVEVSLDADDGQNLKGKIVSIAGSTGAKMSMMPPDNSSGNFVKIVQRVPVKIILDGRYAQRILPGMNVNVSVKKIER